MQRIWGKLADHVGNHVVSSPEGAALVTSTGTKLSYPRPPQSLNPSKPAVTLREGMDRARRYEVADVTDNVSAFVFTHVPNKAAAHAVTPKNIPSRQRDYDKNWRVRRSKRDSATCIMYTHRTRRNKLGHTTAHYFNRERKSRVSFSLRRLDASSFELHDLHNFVCSASARRLARRPKAPNRNRGAQT